MTTKNFRNIAVAIHKDAYDTVMKAIREEERKQRRPISISEFVRDALISRYGLDLSPRH